MRVWGGGGEMGIGAGEDANDKRLWLKETLQTQAS